MLGVLINCSFAQIVSGKEFIEIVYHADSLVFKNKIKEAEIFYKEAEEHYRLSDDWEKWYRIIVKLRRLLVNAESNERLINMLIDFERIIPSDKIFIKGKLNYNIAYSLSRQVKISRAIKYYKKSKLILDSIPEKTDKVQKYIAANYQNISINYSRLGDQKSALKYGNYAIEHCINNNLNNYLCLLIINQGQYLFYDKQYEEAISIYKESFNYCFDNTDIANIHVSIAELFLHQNKLADTKLHLEYALSLDTSYNDYYYIIKANYHLKKGEFNKSEKARIDLFKYLIKINSTKTLIKELSIFSMDLYSLNKKEESLEYAHKSLSYFYPDLDTFNILDRPKDLKSLPYTYIIEALNIKAKYFRDQYLESKDDFALEEATFYYNLLLSHFDKLKSKYYSSSSKYRMGAYSQEIYSEVISFFVDRFNESKDKKTFENAFSLAQRANSFVLRNAISDRKALEMAGVTQDSLEQYLYLASIASSDVDKDSTKSGAGALLEFDAYKESLLSNYPSYGKYDQEEEISLSEIQSSIDNNTQLIKYYYHNELLTIFGISKNSFFAENITFTSEMDSLINLNLDIISLPKANDSLANVYLNNSKYVYDLVLGDIISKNITNEKINHLVILPDGPLKKVPFNALVVDDSQDWSDPTTYLMSKYAINYLYYCSQLKDEDKSYESKDGFIGFGIEYEDEFLEEIVQDFITNFKVNETTSRDLSLSPLKYADDEVLTTADILNGTSIINEDVTPNQVLSSINSFDVIHFSAHAFVDEVEYLNSFVVLNKDEGENYQFKYSDILNLDIDSEMVVLSACQTSTGKTVVGEGLMSLSRAFVQSGSNSTVGAYWNAPDYASKELMTLFYSNLKDGMPKSKAMQKAQIEYLTNDDISSPTIRSPFFWASWAIYGDDQPLRMSKSIVNLGSWKTYLFCAFGILLLFAGYKYIYKKK